MSGNTFGRLFTVTTFGESHGLGLGCVIDGCPPGLELSAADLQPDLDRRKPGTSRFTTQRKEPDEVQILSGNQDGIGRYQPENQQLAALFQGTRHHHRLPPSPN